MSDDQRDMTDGDDVKISVEATDEETIMENSSDGQNPEEVQRRTFSHYPHPAGFIERMINAGFYFCSIRDRVLCIGCGLICEHWRPGIDDPFEVHRTISPNCKCIRSKSADSGAPPPPATPPPMINADLSQRVNVVAPSTVPRPISKAFNCVEIVLTKTSCHPEYAEIRAREKSFNNWFNRSSPATDDMARAGFFYTDKEDTVTCFYCNGSLRHWRANDNPMVEHARWFPKCSYARQLCGQEMYQRIQELQRLQQGFLEILHFLSCSLFIFLCLARFMANERNESNSQGRSNACALNINHRLLLSNQSLLPQLIAARLDLPASLRLLNQGFRLAIIKKCWEIQLTLKGKP